MAREGTKNNFFSNSIILSRAEDNTIVSPTDTLAWGSAPAKRLCGTLWLTVSHSSQTLVAEVSNDAIATGNSVKV